MIVREVVPAALDGERVDRVVSMLTGLSRADASALVDTGAVALDGVPVTTRSRRVGEGQSLDVDVPEPDPHAGEPKAEEHVEVTVVHVDDEVIVVDKPPELVVHPGAGNAAGTLVSGLLARFPDLAGVGDPLRPGIVHRLDKGTSGLLVVARTPVAYESLVAQLSARAVDRRYDALVWGVPSPAQGMVDAPIGRSRRDPTRMTVAAGGREARTRYEVVARFTRPVDVARLVCRLETGRTHQIRVHLAAIGHPIVGDPRYRGARSSFACPRPFLHAGHLGFTHPATGEWVAFDAPLPADLGAVLSGLGPQEGADEAEPDVAPDPHRGTHDGPQGEMPEPPPPRR